MTTGDFQNRNVISFSHLSNQIYSVAATLSDRELRTSTIKKDQMIKHNTHPDMSEDELSTLNKWIDYVFGDSITVTFSLAVIRCNSLKHVVWDKN